jgi:hypothetical protein
LSAEEATVHPQQTPQQQPPAGPKPPDDCPDPHPPYAAYRVTTAVVKERARLYTADAEQVKTRFEKLAGAQKRFADAKTAQSEKFQELKQRMERIATTLKRDVSEADRTRLESCWAKLNDETAPPATTTNCTEVDGVDCDKLPDDAAKLASLETLATTCAALADSEFDTQAGLPDGLEARIAGLLTEATALEQEICASRTDLPRSYVEFLKLQKRFDALAAAWTTPATYQCRLRVAFRTLLRRHTTLICLRVENYRRAQWLLIAEEERQTKETNLVDLVLECVRTSPPS